MKDNKVRVQKIISDSGYCSRRKAEAFIEDGFVKVNGHPIKLGDKADPREDIITVSGEKIESLNTTLRYIKMYKPRGYVTTMEDSHEKKLVIHLLGDIGERIYPVGRLDKNSEGLLILTNDGAFANDIMHPARHVQKIYRVTVPSAVTEGQLDKLMSGIDIGEGVTTRPCVVTPVVEGSDRTVLEFIIKEGKNRQIRKMCEAVGLTVKRLRRTSIGGVKLGMLQPGEYADMTKEELRVLRASIGSRDSDSGAVKAAPRKTSAQRSAPRRTDTQNNTEAKPTVRSYGKPEYAPRRTDGKTSTEAKTAARSYGKPEYAPKKADERTDEKRKPSARVNYGKDFQNATRIGQQKTKVFKNAGNKKK